MKFGNLSCCKILNFQGSFEMFWKPLPLFEFTVVYLYTALRQFFHKNNLYFAQWRKHLYVKKELLQRISRIPDLEIMSMWKLTSWSS